MTEFEKIHNQLQHRNHSPHTMEPSAQKLKKVALVGSPNVGKSLLFGKLTGTYVTVSNYPGTSVEVTRSRLSLGNLDIDVIDTPGIYALLPLTEEERVTRNILLKDHPDLVLHIIDAKNLERMLPLTLQLIEANVPLCLVLNMMDEAEKLGMSINFERLESELGIPVIGTVSTTGRGFESLKKTIRTRLQYPCEQRRA